MRKCQIFSSLDEEGLKDLLKKFEKVYLGKDKILFRQGELSHSIYLLVSGEMTAYLKKENEETILETIFTGETIGELSALSREPRSVTMKASENSILLKMSSDDFQTLCQEYPSVSLGTIHSFVNRSRKLIQLFSEPSFKKKHVAIIAAHLLDLGSFSNQLQLHIQSIKNITLISDYDLEFKNQFKTIQEIQNFIDEFENESILYILKSTETLLAEVCFKKMDSLYIVAKSHSTFELSPFIKEKIKIQKITPELVLLIEANSLPPVPIKSLNLPNFSLNHRIRLSEEKDCKRLLRFMSGQAIGVVLGGGGLRSWAHLGALNAIIESGFPIDIIGGTSAGAIVAAHYTLHGLSNEGELRELSSVARNIVSLKNLTWPTLSLFDTKEYQEKQKSLFSHINIEDMSLPCFFIACNLSKNTQIIHRKGSLWKAIASSTAVPAIFPPVLVKGELLVDGGILNNLPVDIMKRSVGPRGKVIAVELTHYDHDPHKYNFPPYPTLWDTLKNKLGISEEHYRYPSFLDTFLKSLLAGSTLKQEENSAAADILVKPDLSKFRLMDVSKPEEDKLISMGHHAAKKAIELWKQSNDSSEFILNQS